MTYTFRGRANPWTDQQKAVLWQLREVEGLPWPVVAKRCGHPKGSCQTCLSTIRRERVSGVTRSGPDGTDLARPRKLMLRAPANLVMPPALPPSARTMRTAILVADAELRARCEVLGLTGGLLGDPLPGRSALDRRGQGDGALSISLATDARALCWPVNPKSNGPNRLGIRLSDAASSRPDVSTATR